MIEVFKTDITCLEQANHLVEQIHKNFVDYKANFDMHDCDKVLRVVCSTGSLSSSHFIDWLKNMGCTAEVLSDN